MWKEMSCVSKVQRSHPNWEDTKRKVRLCLVSFHVLSIYEMRCGGGEVRKFLTKLRKSSRGKRVRVHGLGI